MRLIFTFLSLFLIQTGFSQGVGIGTAAPDSSAALDVRSVTKGILIPRMGRTTMYDIVRPAKGLLIYDSVQNQLWANMGEPDAPNWNEMTVNSAWGINGNHGTGISQFIGTSDDEPLSFRVRALGSLALEANTVGVENAALGSRALAFNTTGSDNCALGVSSLTNNIDGVGNTVVICTASSQARIGNSATNSIGGYANWTNFSDGRYKKNMRENVKGIDFIMRLRPITYNLDVTGIQNKLGAKRPADAGSEQAIADKEAMVFSGFAAQEVEQAAQAAGYDFSGVDRPKNDNDFYGLRYSDFVVPLVKAMQEQQRMILQLQKKLDQQAQQINQLLNKK